MREGGPEEGRRRGGGARGGRRFCRLDSAGVGHGRAREDVEWVRGEVAQLGVQQIVVGRRGTVDAELGGGSSSFLLRASARKEKGEAKTKTSLGNDKAELDPILTGQNSKFDMGT